MTPEDIAKKVLQAVEDGDYAGANGLLTDDFVFDGPVPQPIGAQQWLGLHRILSAAMPDFSFNMGRADVQGNEVMIPIQISGTHTQTLDMSPMGMPTVPATGIAVRLPVEQPVFMIRGNKIASMHVTPTPGGGVPGLLAQLGVDMGH